MSVGYVEYSGLNYRTDRWEEAAYFDTDWSLVYSLTLIQSRLNTDFLIVSE